MQANLTPDELPPSPRRGMYRLSWLRLSAILALRACCLLPFSAATAADSADGGNPHPLRLTRPLQQPLSAIAVLGRAIYFDPGLSVSGRRACASCHDPAHAYGPPDGLSAQFGGPQLKSQGRRATPSLTYAYRLPEFSIGPDVSGDEAAAAAVATALPAAGSPAPVKNAGSVADATAMVPQGGLFWDGRANSLQDQARGPLLNPDEMGNRDLAEFAARLGRAPYRDDFAKIFGAWVLKDPPMVAREALLAIARFQIEDASFHAYSSKFDYWLEGKANFSAAEMRGYRLFNDPQAANCGGCHIDTIDSNGIPPLLTDNQYEALAVPRNPELAANRNPDYYDLGLCGPVRTDLKQQTQYCGLFRTPSLRNAAQRTTFFHNGRYHTLRQVLEFYNFRDTAPDRIYAHRADGSLAIDDDLPPRYRGNIDVRDAPFNRHRGDTPAMSDKDMDDVVAFLQTLSDGYRPER